MSTKRPTAKQVAKRHMTYEEFSRLPEQPGLQLIDGMLVKEPSPVYSHQACLGTLYTILRNHVLPRKLGQVILAPFDVVLADDTVLQPDVLFVQSSRIHLIQERGLFGAPDLAVEILLPSTRRYDEGRKRELYLQHGCEELWLVDLDSRTLHQHVAAGTVWHVKTHAQDAVLTSHTVPQLEVSLAHVFSAPLL